MTFGELLYDVCGGPRDGREFKAVIPGGSSSKVMRLSLIHIFPRPDAGPEGQRRARHFHEGIPGIETGKQAAHRQMRDDHN